MRATAQLVIRYWSLSVLHEVTTVTKYQGLQKFAYMLLFFPLLKPESIEYLFPFADNLYDILQIMSALIILFLFFIKRQKIHAFLIAAFFYSATLMISTMINQGAFFSAFVYISKTVALLLLVDLLLDRGVLFCVDSLLPVMEIMIFANLLSILLYPNGMFVVVHYLWKSGNSWLLGYDNSHISYFLFAIVLSMLRTYYSTGKATPTLRNWVLLAMCVASVCICQQGNGRVAMFLMMVFVLFPWLFSNARIFNIRTYVIIAVIFFLAIIIFRMQKVLEPIVVDILHKDLTFTGRTKIWDRAIQSILSHPLWGIGRETDEVVFPILGLDHAHNMYLQTAFQGGIFNCISFLAMIFVTMHSLMKNRDKLVVQFLSFSVFVILMLYQTEVYTSPLIFCVILTAYKSYKIVKQQSEDIVCDHRGRRVVFRWGPRRVVSAGNGR